MANPFARRAQPQQSNPYGYNVQNNQDPVDYTTEMIKRSGGDAKAAFYLACKEKGVDADAFIRGIQTMQNPKGAIQQAVMSDPRVKNLFALYSSVK